MNKGVIVFFFTFLVPIMASAQSGYYATDSSMTSGVRLVEGGEMSNAKFCRVKQEQNVKQYTPYEIKEYGFKDGRVYLSKDIQITDTAQKVFLERLVNGSTTLFYYKGEGGKTFFIEQDSTLFIEIPKHRSEKVGLSFNDNLQHITSDCPGISDATKLVRYNKKSLSKLIARYNQCELKPFPFFKYGLTAGYGAVKLIASRSDEHIYLDQLDLKDRGFTVGLFIDSPILVSDFSLHIDLYYSRYGFAYNKQIENKDIDFVANISALNLPLLIRYAYPSNKTRPFINAGGVFTTNFKHESALFEASITQDIIEINDVAGASLIAENQVGYVIGGGIEYKLNYKHSLFFELRHQKLYGLSEAVSLNNAAIQLITGINF